MTNRKYSYALKKKKIKIIASEKKPPKKSQWLICTALYA